MPRYSFSLEEAEQQKNATFFELAKLDHHRTLSTNLESCLFEVTLVLQQMISVPVCQAFRLMELALAIATE